MTTAAIYDAVNGIEVAAGDGSRESAIVASYASAPPDGDRRAAASAAAHAVLGSLFSSNAAVKESLDQALVDELAALGSDPAVEAGRAWGALVGDEVVSRRSNDGTQTSESLVGGSGPGVFPRTFSGTQFRNMTPFGVASVAPYRSAGPPPLASSDYAEDLNEVKALGSRANTNPKRAAIARHWLA